MSLVYFNGNNAIYTDSILVLDEARQWAHKSFALTPMRHAAWVGDCGPALALLYTLRSTTTRKSMTDVRQVPLGEAGAGMCSFICVDYTQRLLAYWHFDGEHPVSGQLLPFQPLVLGYDDAKHALRYALQLGSQPRTEHEQEIFVDVVAYHDRETADASVALPAIRLAAADTDHQYLEAPDAAAIEALEADCQFIHKVVAD